MKRNLKIFICITLILFLSMSVAACGGGNVDDDDDSNGSNDWSGPNPGIFYLKPPPEDPDVELSVEGADLDGAPGVVVESGHIVKWGPDNTVSWEFEVEKTGIYTIGVLYSRPEGEEVWGMVNIYPEGATDPRTLIFRADPSSLDDDDWSVYNYKDTMSSLMEAGKYRLEIVPGTPEYPFSEEHFINLQSILLCGN